MFYCFYNTLLKAKAGRATAVFFPIVPTTIGKIKITITADSSKFKDTVIKHLRVEVRKSKYFLLNHI